MPPSMSLESGSRADEWSSIEVAIVGLASSFAAVFILILLAVFLCASKKRGRKDEEAAIPIEIPQPSSSAKSRDDSGKTDSDKESSAKTNEPTVYAAPSPSVKAVYDFALDLYRVTCLPHSERRPGQQSDTIYRTKVVSPLAIQAAMFPCYLGASGRTKDEIRQAVYPRLMCAEALSTGCLKRVDDCAREVAAMIDGPSSALAEVCPFQGFSMAMRVYAPANRYQYSSKFYDDMSDRGCRLCDFIEYRFDAGVTPTRAPLPLATFANSVNHFVHAASKGQIRHPVTEHILKEALYLPAAGTSVRSPSPTQKPAGLLVFAFVHVRCKWVKPFSHHSLFKARFKVAPGDEPEVEMMRTRSKMFRYFEDENCRAVRLPLADERSRSNMYILMPATPGALANLEAWLTGEKLLKIVTQCRHPGDIEVTMPKLFADSKLSATRMTNCLRQLGLKTSFEPQYADFTPMIEKQARQPLHITAVIHDGVLEAYDEDTGAASDSSKKEPTKRFDCNELPGADILR